MQICGETDLTNAHGSVGCIGAEFWSSSYVHCSNLRLSHSARGEVRGGTLCRQLLLTVAWLGGLSSACLQGAAATVINI